MRLAIVLVYATVVPGNERLNICFAIARAVARYGTRHLRARSSCLVVRGTDAWHVARSAAGRGLLPISLLFRTLIYYSYRIPLIAGGRADASKPGKKNIPETKIISLTGYGSLNTAR